MPPPAWYADLTPMAVRSPFPRICVALGFDTAEALFAHARMEYDAGERFLEFRLDYLKNPEHGVEIIQKFLARHSDCTLLATCRRHQNQGRFNGSIEGQLRVLDHAVTAGAKAIDIEIESAESCVRQIEGLRSHVFVLVSYHNYGGTPALDPVMRRMLRVPADGYKIVTTAKKPSDNIKVLGLTRSHSKVPLVVLAMGEMGFPTRILSFPMGAIYTYAAPNGSEGTATGQVPAKQLRSLYHAEKLSKSAKVFGVVADPVRHSISPAVHNRAFQARRIDAVYLPFLVKPVQLKDFFTFAAKMPLHGFSVTLPHKQKIMRYLDVVEPLARRIGAVNTVFRKAGKWRGTNTDIDGVLRPLEKRLKLNKSTALVVGNGGAARGAAYALAAAGTKLAITGRNIDRVRVLAKATGAELLSRAQAEARTFDVLIHATPLGMSPRMDQCFFEQHIPAKLVFDMVYNPLETTLLRRAKALGLETISGLEMFLEQASRQFEIFTGENAPRSVMEKAAREALTARQA